MLRIQDHTKRSKTKMLEASSVNPTLGPWKRSFNDRRAAWLTSQAACRPGKPQPVWLGQNLLVICSTCTPNPPISRLPNTWLVCRHSELGTAICNQSANPDRKTFVGRSQLQHQMGIRQYNIKFKPQLALEKKLYTPKRRHHQHKNCFQPKTKRF